MLQSEDAVFFSSAGRPLAAQSASHRAVPRIGIDRSRCIRAAAAARCGAGSWELARCTLPQFDDPADALQRRTAAWRRRSHAWRAHAARCAAQAAHAA
jgi:hypothetical protein